MNITYISRFCNNTIFNEIFKQTINKPGNAAQKYHRLIVEGLAEHNHSINIITLSPIPKNSNISFYKSKTIKDKNIKYLSFIHINIPIISNLVIFFYISFQILFIARKSRIIIHDGLVFKSSLSLMIFKFFIPSKIVGVFTDLPEFLFKNKFILYFNQLFLNIYNGFILINENLKDKILNKKPYFIIEGLVSLKESKCNYEIKQNDFIVLYSGGIEIENGIKFLVETFKNILDLDIKLHLYGGGNYVKNLINDLSISKNIFYFGNCNNDHVICAQKNADLLINPRSSTNEFTKYSFPSKNIEYLLSGNPTLIYDLPGIPNEYHNYFLYIKGPSQEDLLEAILSAYNINKSDRELFGKKAKEFVLNNKNNILVTHKLIGFISSL
jgi:hypothetical protein